jgi:hypothetical protein
MDFEKWRFYADILGILIVLVGVGYVIYNFEIARAYLDDPCQMCREFTGGICISSGQYEAVKKVFNSSTPEEKLLDLDNITLVVLDK